MLLVEAQCGFGISEVVKRLECMVSSGKEVPSSVISNNNLNCPNKVRKVLEKEKPLY